MSRIDRGRSLIGRPYYGRALPWIVVALLLTTLTLTLTLLAAGNGVLPGDVAVANGVQRSDLPGAETLAQIAYVLGGTPLIVGLAVGLTTAFARAGHRAEALFLLAIVAVRGANWGLKAIVESPRPNPTLVRVSEQASGLGFPSTHVLSAVLLYGGIIFLACHRVRCPWRRAALIVAAAAAILVTGFGRIYTGAHWPSDVLGGYLWGTVLLLAVLAFFRLGRRRLALARVRRTG